jgi:hypothetical protein
MKTLTLPLALLLAAAPPAFAADHDMGMGMGDCPMHDSAMTDAERAERMNAMFARIDADGNGTIDRAEFDKYHEHMRGMRDMHDMHGEQDKAAPAPAVDEHAGHH